MRLILIGGVPSNNPKLAARSEVSRIACLTGKIVWLGWQYLGSGHNFTDKVVVMNEEIQRIKSKDYSQLDERLFNNIGASSELDGTLVKLAELQKYLLSQIDGIQNQQEKDAVLKASKIVMEMGSRV